MNPGCIHVQALGKQMQFFDDIYSISPTLEQEEEGVHFSFTVLFCHLKIKPKIHCYCMNGKEVVFVCWVNRYF